jgi:hypothetical protein
MCTMVAKKGISSDPSTRENRKALEYLYARRAAIDSLIQSLEQYDRFRTLRFSEPKQKMA